MANQTKKTQTNNKAHVYEIICPFFQADCSSGRTEIVVRDAGWRGAAECLPWKKQIKNLHPLLIDTTHGGTKRVMTLCCFQCVISVGFKTKDILGFVLLPKESMYAKSG